MGSLRDTPRGHTGKGKGETKDALDESDGMAVGVGAVCATPNSEGKQDPKSGGCLFEGAKPRTSERILEGVESV